MTEQTSSGGNNAQGGDGEQAGDGERITLLSIVFSVLAAAFGVQSRRNRERDFTKGNIYVFAIAGIVFTALFVGVLYGIVQLILP